MQRFIYTIKPRLEAAGADCSRIAFLEQSDEEPILLNDVRLAQAIEGTKAKLLVIDPLQAYLGMDGEMQRSNSVRSVLGNLVKVAERTGCAVVLIGHMNKSNRAKGIDYDPRKEVVSPTHPPVHMHNEICCNSSAHGILRVARMLNI